MQKGYLAAVIFAILPWFQNRDI